MPVVCILNLSGDDVDVHLTAAIGSLSAFHRNFMNRILKLDFILFTYTKLQFDKAKRWL